MKNTRVLTLALIIMLATFTGCESEPSFPELTIPQRMTTVKEYNQELFALIVPIVENAQPADFTEGDFVPVDEGITCFVTYSGLDEMTLYMTLDEWVAADGTKIIGTIELEVEYYTSPEVSLHIVRTDRPAFLYFDNSSVSYLAEFLDDEGSDPAYLSDYDYYAWVSMIVDGKLLVNNPIGYK